MCLPAAIISAMLCSDKTSPDMLNWSVCAMHNRLGKSASSFSMFLALSCRGGMGDIFFLPEGYTDLDKMSQGPHSGSLITANWNIFRVIWLYNLLPYCRLFFIESYLILRPIIVFTQKLFLCALLAFLFNERVHAPNMILSNDSSIKWVKLLIFTQNVEKKYRQSWHL